MHEASTFEQGPCTEMGALPQNTASGVLQCVVNRDFHASLWWKEIIESYSVGLILLITCHQPCILTMPAAHDEHVTVDSRPPHLCSC